MLLTTAAFQLSLLALAHAQQIGTEIAEVHPTLSYETCTASGCTTIAGQVTADANWRWLHSTTGVTNCYTGNDWNAELCPDPVTCATNCALDGVDYAGTIGVTTSGSSIKLNYDTESNTIDAGSRLYLMANNTEYKIFKLLNQEFTFDVDVSTLPCGLNGALYFSEMSADGGLSTYPHNKAGAEYGTGYCDSTCPRDLKFVNGVANILDWTATSATSGNGTLGSCCSTMNVWEANYDAAVFTAHPCTVTGQTECTGATCGATSRYSGVCDPDGCDFNSYRMGNTTFYGQVGYGQVGDTVIDTTKPFTVVTQFLTSDNTSTGSLSQIRRLYVQDGIVFQNSQSTIANVTGNSITQAFCDAQKTAFDNVNDFDAKGGLAAVGEALNRGVVLVFSLTDDPSTDMLWLDSDWPVGESYLTPGVARGTCSQDTGAEPVGLDDPAWVTFSNIKVGAIGSTYSGTSS